jgi:hypothetical protein
MTQGYTDKPVETLYHDTFGIKPYINGLCRFILDCDTPMTISVQGDWGSGKTSMMNMIKAKLGEQVLSVWFNTWQYSQFGMRDDLPICLLNSLLKEISIDDEKLKPVLAVLKGIAKATTVIAAESILGGTIAGKMDESLNAKSFDDITNAIKTLKIKFQEAVERKLQSVGKDRLVVFVDDLDRLPPESAVELLEAMKVFLDCENCVYVLAIDYEVVVQGIKIKFGSDVDMKKGRSFFDKIIQLPFKMPVEQYNIEKYVGDMLEKMNLFHTDTLPIYINLIKRSIGFNPRTMKRLFNTFFLLDMIISDTEMIQPYETAKRTLFATLCMQMAYPDLFNIIVNAKEFLDADFLTTLSDTDKIRENADLQTEFKSTEPEMLALVCAFMRCFVDAIDGTPEDGVSEKGIDDLKSILFFSSMTSVMSSAQNAEELEAGIDWEYRYRHKSLADKVNAYLKKTYGYENSIYQPRKTKEGRRISDIYGYKDFKKDNVAFQVGYRLRLDVKNENTYLSFAIYPLGTNTAADVKNIIPDNFYENVLWLDTSYEVANAAASISKDEDELFNYLALRYFKWARRNRGWRLRERSWQ